jgi:hypothetical protein
MRGIGTKPECYPQVPSIRTPTIAISIPLLMFLKGQCGGAERGEWVFVNNSPVMGGSCDVLRSTYHVKVL